MPRYTVSTGGITAHIETPYPADPEALALIALQANIGRCDLGEICSVVGGEYVGDDEMYMATAPLVRALGRMAPEV